MVVIMNKKNVLVLFIYSFLNSFLLYRACDVLYYLSKGISNSEYINYLTIGSLITIIFLIPFGLIKDKYNRKYILLASNLFLLLATVLYICVDNVLVMGIGIIMSAISNLLSQGIVISLLHSYMDDKKEYTKMYYKWSIFYYSGYLISMILGGVVAKFSLVSMYYISIIPIMMNFLVLLFFDDSYEKSKRKNSSKLLKESYKLLKSSRLLKIILLSEMVIIPLADILAESHPEYLSNIGASTTLIGIYTAIMCLFAIVGNKIATIYKNQNNKFFVFALLFNFSLILIGLLNNYFSIIFIILFQCFFSVTNNIYNTIVQNECNDSYRQTVLAIFTFITSISEMIICTITSLIFKNISLGNSYVVLGIFGLAIISIAFLFSIFKKKNVQELSK